MARPNCSATAWTIWRTRLWTDDTLLGSLSGDRLDVEFVTLARAGLSVEKRMADWFTAVSPVPEPTDGEPVREVEERYPWLPLPLDNEVADLLLAERARARVLMAAIGVEGDHTWARSARRVRVITAAVGFGDRTWAVTDGLRDQLHDEAGRPADLVAFGQAAADLSRFAIHDIVESPQLLGDVLPARPYGVCRLIDQDVALIEVTDIESAYVDLPDDQDGDYAGESNAGRVRI